MANSPRDEIINNLFGGGGARDNGQSSSFKQPTPVGRDQIYANLFGSGTAQTQNKPTVPTSRQRIISALPTNIAPKFNEKKEGGSPFDNMGIFGDLIGVIDKGRAIAVSTVKEVGDAIRGDGFDLGEWWTQIDDNMMMGEVLRDWNVDLPGPLDFIVGLGFDIALDPLTYMAGLGIAARFSNPAKVVTALERASRTAKSAKQATMLRSAAGRVAAKKSISAAGDEALKEIGMSAGIRFTVPGTGRLGRRIIERPLRSLTGGGKGLDIRRVKQLPGANIPKNATNPWIYKAGSEGLNLADPKIQEKIALTMGKLRKGGKVTSAEKKFVPFAQQASRMPVEAIRIPGTEKFVQVFGGAAGALFGAAAATKLGKLIGSGKQGAGGLSPDYNWHAKFREYGRKAAAGDQGAAETLSEFAAMRYSRDKWIMEQGRWEGKTLTELEDLYRSARTIGLDESDVLSTWMLKYAEEPMTLADGSVNPWLFKAEPRIYDAGSAQQNFYTQARSFWDGMGNRGKEVLGDAFALVKDELYVTRYLSEELADESLLNVANDFVEIIRGDAMKGRKFAMPKTLANEISEVEAATLIRRHRLPIEINSDGLWRKQLSDAIDTLGSKENITVTIKTLDGKTLTNDIHNGALTNNGGSVRRQITELGEAKYGNDYKQMYSDNFNKTIVRYVSQVGNQIRVKGLVKEMENSGVFARGIGQRAWGQTVDEELKTISDAQSGQVIQRGTKESANNKLVKLDAQIQKHADRLYDLEVQLKNIGVIKIGQTIDQASIGVNSARVIKARALTEKIMQAEEVAEKLRGVIASLQRGDFGAVKDLNIEAFELLVPATVRSETSGRVLQGIKSMVRQMADRPKHLASIEEATEYISRLAGKVGEILDVRATVQQTLNNLDDPAMASVYIEMLNELDDILVRSFDDLGTMNRTYLNNMMDDPTVRSAEILTAMRSDYDAVIKANKGASLDNFLQDMTGGAGGGRRVAGKDIADVLPGNYTNAEKQLLELAAGLGDKNIVKWVENVNVYSKLAAELQPDNLYVTLVREAAEASRQAGAPLGYMDDIAGLPIVQEKIAMLEARLVARQSGNVAETLEELTVLKNYEQELTATMQVHKTELEATEAEIRRMVDNLKASPSNARNISKRDELINDEMLRDGLLNDARADAAARLKEATDTGTLSEKLGAVGKERLQAGVADPTKEIEKARFFINNARAQAGLSDVYGDVASDWLQEFANLTNVVTKSTERALQGQVLISGGLRNLSKEASKAHAQVFAEMFQAMARLQDPMKFGEFLKQYRVFMNYWKAQAVSTPGFFMRNGVGGMWINNQIAGVPMGTHARVLGIRNQALKIAKANNRPDDVTWALGKMIEDGGFNFKTGATGARRVNAQELKAFREWYSTGIASSGQVSQEVRTLLDLPGAGKKGVWNPFKSDFKYYNVIRRRNMDTEFILRGALAHHMITGGQSAEDAFRTVTKYHFDYSNLTSLDQRIKLAIPFWTWQKNIIPVLLESIGKQPRAWSRLLQVKGELELTSPEEGIVSEYIGKNLGVRLPFKMGGNRVYTMPDLPFRDLNKYTKLMGDSDDPWYEKATDVKGLARGVGGSLFESSLPLFRLPFEIWAGKQVFAGLPLTGRDQQMPHWANAPVLRDVLLSVGLADKSSTGRYTMSDVDMYKVEAFFPLIARIRRLVPNEKRKQEHLYTTIINTIIGGGFRQNTSAMQRSETIRQQREFADDWQKYKDVEFRDTSSG